jgi:hypothetical protein
LITDVLGVAGSFQTVPRGVDLSSFDPDFFVGTSVMVVYTIIFFILGIIVANRRKME